MNTKIRALRTEAKMTQRQLAKRVGVSNVSVSQWERGDAAPRGANMHELCVALGCSEAWLLGKSPRRGGHGDVADVRPLRIPLLTEDQVLRFSDIEELGGEHNWRHTGVDTGRNGFAMRVAGDSMCSPAAPLSIPAGAVVVADPDIQHKSGSIVIARIIGAEYGDCVVVRKFTIDGGRAYLIAADTRYPPIRVDENVEIVAMVRQVEIEIG